MKVNKVPFKVVIQFISYIFFYSNSIVQANIVGTNLQNFNPTSNGIDFVTVQSSETLSAGIFNFGIFANYSKNGLPKMKNENGDLVDLNDHLLYGDFNIGLGITKRLEVGLNLPVILNQTIDENTTGIAFSNKGLTEYRLNLKYHLWAKGISGLAFVGSANINQIEDNPFSGKDAGHTYNFEFAYDMNFKRYDWAVNVGYRLRKPGRKIEAFGISPLDDSFLFSTAFSYMVRGTRVKLIGEVLSSVPMKTAPEYSKKELSSLELIGGLKYHIRKNIAFHSGVGAGVLSGTSTPTWRVYTGLNWSFGPLWGREYVKVVVPKKIARKRRKNIIKVYRLRGLSFVSSSSQVSVESESKLEKLINYLRRVDSNIKNIIVTGHTDSLGDSFFNQSLSEDRARGIASYISRNTKIGPDKIESNGRGENEPIASNGNYQGQAKNRRVDVRIFLRKRMKND